MDKYTERKRQHTTSLHLTSTLQALSATFHLTFGYPSTRNKGGHLARQLTRYIRMVNRYLTSGCSGLRGLAHALRYYALGSHPISMAKPSENWVRTAGQDPQNLFCASGFLRACHDATPNQPKRQNAAIRSAVDRWTTPIAPDREIHPDMLHALHKFALHTLRPPGPTKEIPVAAVPNANACFERSTREGGTTRALAEQILWKKQARAYQVPHQWMSPKRVPSQPMPPRQQAQFDQDLFGSKRGDEQFRINVRKIAWETMGGIFTLFSPNYRPKTTQEFREAVGQVLLDTDCAPMRPLVVDEGCGGKIRVASTHPACLAHTLRNINSLVLQQLLRWDWARHFNDQRPVRIWRRLPNKEGLFLLSDDWKSASDYLPWPVVRAITSAVEIRFSNILSPAEKLALSHVASPKRLYFRDQDTGTTTVRGAHMGLSLAWAILTIINGFIGLQNVPEKAGHGYFHVNGDDYVGLHTKKEIQERERMVHALGLVPNPNKSFVSPTHGVFSERLLSSRIHKPTSLRWTFTAKDHLGATLSELTGYSSEWQRVKSQARLELLSQVYHRRITPLQRRICLTSLLHLNEQLRRPHHLPLALGGTGIPHGMVSNKAKAILARFLCTGQTAPKGKWGHGKSPLAGVELGLGPTSTHTDKSPTPAQPTGSYTIKDLATNLSTRRDIAARITGVPLVSRPIPPPLPRIQHWVEQTARRWSPKGGKFRGLKADDLFPSSHFKSTSSRQKLHVLSILQATHSDRKAARLCVSALQKIKSSAISHSFARKCYEDAGPQVLAALDGQMVNPRTLYSGSRRKRRSRAPANWESIPTWQATRPATVLAVS